MSPFRQFWFILKFAGKFFWQTDKKIFLATIFANSVTSLVIIPNLLLDKAFIDILVNNVGKPYNQLAVNSLLLIVFARFGLASLRSISNRISGYLARLFFMRNNQRAEVLVGQKYATIGIPTLEDPKFRDRYQKIERESLNRLQRVGENYIRIPQHITGIVASLSIFVATQPWIIAVSILSLIPSIFVDRFFIKKSYELDTQVGILHRKRGLYSYYLARTRSYLESRILNIYQHLTQKIVSLWDEIIAGRLKLLRRRRIWGAMADLIDDGVAYSLDGVFAIQAVLGQISIGTAQAYVRAIANFKQSVSNLTAAVLEMYENYLYLDDLVWFLNLDNPYYNEDGVKLTDSLNIGIKFDHVWFKYPGTKNWILKDVSFHILPHQNIAIVGKNGAGKTTLVKLLCGFYEPQKGRITVDNIPVSELNKPEYWRRLATLFQDSSEFGLTIREVISAGNISKADDLAAIKHIAKSAQIADWIESLPQKYDNFITRDFENGVSPSSGQWQKLIIARALYKESEILVLDEPTSNVDPEAEEKIFEQILAIGKDKIIIFISHRFSTVRKADQIVVLDKGTVTESGNHMDLIKQAGTYSRLFKLQAKSYL